MSVFASRIAWVRRAGTLLAAVTLWQASLQPAAAEDVPEITAIQRNHRVTNPPGATVLLADVRPVKLVYRPEEEIRALARLVNTTARGADVQVRIWREHGLGEVAGHQERTVHMPPRAARTIEFTWPAGTAAAHGNAVAIELRQGDAPPAVGRDVFSCVTNLWEMAIGALPNGPAANSANYTREQILGQVRGWRDQYCNVWEKYFWAPDDWGQLTVPPNATWYSGQARRHENAENLRFHIEASHAEGIAVVTYGKCMAGGPHGWEMARAKPQWFPTDTKGHTMGRPADVWDLEHWQEGKSHAYSDYKYIWTYRWVDLRRLDALDHGIDQLSGSTSQFGWDGVRFDSGGFRGHFVDGKFNGNDVVNLRNMKRTKERLWARHPDYLLGFNTDNTTGTDGRGYPLSAGEMSREMREMLAGGGLWMGEAIKHFSNGSVTYRRWSEFARDERRCVGAVREAGGHFCYLYANSTAVRNLYQFVIGLMIGAHPYGGEHVGLPGSANWGGFMTRWGGLFWDARLRPLDVDAAGLDITADRPLWWREFANERILGRDRRQVVVHLLNPPVDDEIGRVLKPVPKDVEDLVAAMDRSQHQDGDEFLEATLGPLPEAAGETRTPNLSPEVVACARAQRMPSPVPGAMLRMRIPDGQTARKAWFVFPGSPNQALAAECREEHGVLLVNVPEFAVWAMVVCEFAGQFSEPEAARPARFAAPLTDAESAELTRRESSMPDPLPAFGVRPPAPTPNIPIADAGPEPLWAGIGDRDPGVPGQTTLPTRTMGGEEGLDILIVNGFYHATYRVAESVKFVAAAARITSATSRDLPAGLDELAAFDTVVLVNMPASAWKPEGQQALVDYVLAGGRLVILGGPFTLGQGDFRGTPLEQVLPVRLLPGRDVVALPAPVPFRPDASTTAFPGHPAIYFVHAARPVAAAETSTWAGDWPLLVKHAVGRGHVAVFLGTPLGEPQAAETPFWKSEAWLRLCGELSCGQ